MAGIIFEDDTKEEPIEDKYRTITDQKINAIIEALTVKSLSLNRQKKHNESQIITGITASLNQLKRLKEEYKRLSMKEQITDFDIDRFAELDNKMRQIWLVYLKSR